MSRDRTITAAGSRKLWHEHILQFMRHLDLQDIILPQNIVPLYPMRGEHRNNVDKAASAFYRKYYSDQLPRRFLIGINPGRLGAGATGIPFTDTKRLASDCQISLDGLKTHEPSSVFIYQLIDAYGGPDRFYRDFYITSVCPVGFAARKPNEKLVNYNYYDHVELQQAVEKFIISKMQEQIAFGADTTRAFCLGTGKNYHYLSRLNEQCGFFREIIPLEHPRYVMQYRNKFKQEYIEKFLRILSA